MKKPTKILFILFVLFIIAFPVLAQRSGSLTGSGSSNSGAPESKATLTVKCNVRNAQVEIFDAYNKNRPQLSGTAPFSAQLEKGFYSIKVYAQGYEVQQQSVNLNNSTTLNFRLDQAAPVKASLTVKSNTRNARVVITGIDVNGQVIGSAPYSSQIPLGRYSITVSAAGYTPLTKEINLTGNRTVNFNLDAETYNLTITSNVESARVFIKGGDINGQITGQTDLTTTLPPGTYRIKVNAPGYFAEEKTVQFSRTSSVNFQLRQRSGRLEVIIPNDILNYTLNNLENRIKIYDNGTEVDGTSLTLSPGQHTIRITSGGFARQQTINVRAGESYRLELNFGFTLIKQ
ncbi:MAG: PEGA domain-containing protein [Spirochaetales bacterium]|uniref:PEGA domain-containing protein n=1 Tax=Candidatus Thalassospirochaeta sargassi TaxID=3119039 RepID=A0AAJ1MHS3_9SPIO|nr:PEGA domain-containing protein [Spirochaetales bacterium]